MLVHMVKNTFFALPFAIVYTFVFIFVALLHGKKSENTTTEILKTFSLLALLKTVKYYFYANFSMLAFEDKYTYTTLRDSATYLRSNSGRLLSVFVNTAVVSGVVMLYLFVLVVWADKIPFFTHDMVFSIILVVAALVATWMVFVEQILFLLNFIQVRHPQYDVYSLLDTASRTEKV